MESPQNNVLQQFLDFFSTTDKTNFFVRVGSIFVMILAIFLYNKQDVLVEVWKQTRYEDIIKLQQEERNKRYSDVVKEQLQIQYQVVRPDLVQVWEYYPSQKNDFAQLIGYEGKLPSDITVDDLKNITVNKQSNEYLQHLIKGEYQGQDFQDAILPKKDEGQEVKHVFQCAIYNLDNIYQGMLQFVWYRDPDHTKKDPPINIIQSQCLQQTRVLGRAK